MLYFLQEMWCRGCVRCFRGIRSGRKHSASNRGDIFLVADWLSKFSSLNLCALALTFCFNAPAAGAWKRRVNRTKTKHAKFTFFGSNRCCRPVRLTFDVEVHRLAHVGPDVIADSTQVETTVFFQHVLDEQRAVDQHFNPKAWVEGDGFKLWDSSACQRKYTVCQ